MYKRQILSLALLCLPGATSAAEVSLIGVVAGKAAVLVVDGGTPVSYTHLTLPTSDLV